MAHTITVVNHLIFYSTCEHILKLLLEALNWLCANDNGYAKVYMAVCFNRLQERKWSQGGVNYDLRVPMDMFPNRYSLYLGGIIFNRGLHDTCRCSL